MKNYVLSMVSMLALLLFANVAMAQTNPTPQTLPYTQSFGTAGFSSMPAGMAAWISGGNKTTQASAESGTPGGDATLSTASNTTTTGGVFGYAASSNARPYIQQSSNATNGTSQLGLSFNTGVNTSVVVSYQVELLNTGVATQDYGLELMYHSGNVATTAWTAVSASSLVITGTSFATQTFSYTLTGLTPSTNYQLRWVTWRPTGSGNSKGVGFDNISVTAPPSSPTVAITGQDPNTPSLVNWAIGSTGNIFYSAAITPTSGSAVLNAVTTNMTGTYLAADINTSGLKLYYSADATLVPAGDVLLGSQSSAKSGATENITWSGLSQSIAAAATGYIYATADISGSATAGRTLAGSFTSNTNVVFSPTVAYNGSNTYGVTTDKTFLSLPTNPATFNLSCASEVELSMNMSVPAVGSVLVFANTGGGFTTPTGAGSGFTGANADISLATNYAAVGGKLVYSGAGANFTVTGLTAGQTYSLKAYSYSGSNWSSGSAVVTASAITAPVTSTVVTPANGQVQLSWTNPGATSCYNNVIVIGRQGSAVEAAVSKANFDGLVSDADFTGATNTWSLNSGTNDVYALTANLIGTTNTNFLVYKGTGNSVTVNGLTNGTTYYFRIFTVDGVNTAARWSAAVDANGTPDLPGYYWNGGNISALPANGGAGTWSTTSAWRQPGPSGSQATWANNNLAVFAGNAGVVTLDAAKTVSSCVFNTSSYTLQTGSSTAQTITGPVVIGNNNELVLAPNLPGLGASGTMGFGSISGSGTASITLYGDQIAGNAARISLASTSATVSVPTNIVSTSGAGVAGYVSTAVGSVINGNITNNSPMLTMLGATSGFDLLVSSVISGTAGLQISAGPSGGAGKITLSNVNTYSGPTIFNAANSGTVALGVNNALPAGTNLTMAFSGSNGGILDMNGFNQTVGNIANGAGAGSITNNGASSTSTLAITQTTAGSFNRPMTDGSASSKLAIVKNGPALLTLNGTGYSFSGGLTINNGELRINPTATPLNLATCPVVLNGGTFGTSGISGNYVLNFSTLMAADNSTIDLSTSSAHTINFANSSALSWAPTKTITITGWQGNYATATGTTGTKGHIVVGTNTTALTATQLSQIQFFDGTTYYDAMQLTNGEVVPYQPTSLTQLRSSYCGYTAQSYGEFIAADSVLTANYYEFQLMNAANSFTQTFTNSSGYPYLALYLVPGVTNGTTYTTTVRWSPDGTTWSPYGPACDLTAPANATTQLSSGSCGATAASYSQLLFADAVSGATQYRFQFENAALSYTQVVTKNNNNFNLSQFTGLSNNTTYTVTVGVFINGAWDIYGPACTVITPNAPTTQLTGASCGATASSYVQLLFAASVPGATQYEYQLINSSLSYTQSFVKTNSNFILAQFSNLANNTTYSVSVRVFVNGAWGPYGTSCNVTTPGAPTTQLSTGSCGSTPATYNTLLFADAVNGATQYEYQMVNTALSYTQSFAKTNNNIILSQFSGLVNNTTYSMSVRVFMNGAWGPYGSTCDVTVPGSPTTQLASGYCGFTASSYTQIINVNSVGGATQYEYQLTNAALSYTQSFVKTNWNFVLSQFSGLTNNTTYTVQVRVFFNGAWGPYGTGCTVTTPASSVRLIAPQAEQAVETSEQPAIAASHNETIDLPVFEASAYPNPFGEVFALNLKTSNAKDMVSISVFDVNGQLLEQHSLLAGEVSSLSLGAGYKAGLYTLFVVQGNNSKAIKVVKQ